MFSVSFETYAGYGNDIGREKSADAKGGHVIVCNVRADVDKGEEDGYQHCQKNGVERNVPADGNLSSALAMCIPIC